MSDNNTDREALKKIIYTYETIDFRESRNFTTRDCYGVVDAILAAGFRRQPEAVTDESEWEYGCMSSAHRRAGVALAFDTFEPHDRTCPSPAPARRRKAGPWELIAAYQTGAHEA